MDSFLREHHWQGPFPRPLLMQQMEPQPLTGITPTRFGAGRIPSMEIGTQLATAPTPGEFDVPPGTDISVVPAAMQAIFEFANGDADLAADLAKKAGWLVPEIDD